ALAGSADSVAGASGPSHPGDEAPADAVIAGRWRDDRAAYADKIATCHRALRAGDSYELCLTTAFDVDDAASIDALELFEDLATHHPAPYAALVEFDDESGPVSIVSASPERYLRGRGGRFETKPIKGTAARHPDPAMDRLAAEALATDAKTYAENLMIVDLL
ncbi:MAG: chorismate-binding protein, partial [Pseudoclavibacter sp.]